MKWFNIELESCGCSGRPKTWGRIFALEAVDPADAVRQARERVPAGSIVRAVEIGA